MPSVVISQVRLLGALVNGLKEKILQAAKLFKFEAV